MLPRWRMLARCGLGPSLLCFLRRLFSGVLPLPAGGGCSANSAVAFAANQASTFTLGIAPSVRGRIIGQQESLNVYTLEEQDIRTPAA